jgi:hypothetical protein
VAPLKVTAEQIQNMSVADYAGIRQQLLSGVEWDALHVVVPPDIVECRHCHTETLDFQPTEWPGQYLCVYCSDLQALTVYVDLQVNHGKQALVGIVIFLVALAFVLCL